MSKTKIIEKEVEIITIKDIGKLDKKKKSKKKKSKKKKSEEEDEPETPKTIEERIVALKLKDGKINYSLNIKGKKSIHPLKHLQKLNDIGLKAQLTLKIGPNPQKTLDEIHN